MKIYNFIIWKILILDFGVVWSPDRFSRGPSTHAEWAQQRNGRSGSSNRDFQYGNFSTKKVVNKIWNIENRNSDTRMTGLEAQCTPHECWDREKTDPVITQHQNLKLKIFILWIYIFSFSILTFWFLGDRCGGNNQYAQNLYIYFQKPTLEWVCTNFQRDWASNFFTCSNSLLPLRNLGLGSLT